MRKTYSSSHMTLHHIEVVSLKSNLLVASVVSAKSFETGSRANVSHHPSMREAWTLLVTDRHLLAIVPQPLRARIPPLRCPSPPGPSAAGGSPSRTAPRPAHS